MSEKNLELLHRTYDGWARGDFGAGPVRMASDARWSWQTPEGPVKGEGLANWERNFREFLQQWSQWRNEAREFVELGDNCFLVATDTFATGKQSGVEVSSTVFHSWVFRGGEVVEWHAYFDREAALEAAGLSE